MHEARGVLRGSHVRSARLQVCAHCLRRVADAALGAQLSVCGDGTPHGAPAPRSPSTATDDVEDAMAVPKQSLLAITAICSERQLPGEERSACATNHMCTQEVR